MQIRMKCIKGGMKDTPQLLIDILMIYASEAFKLRINGRECGQVQKESRRRMIGAATYKLKDPLIW